MPHINNLNPQILYRILFIASGEPAKNIDEWKDRLFLLQVCTKWYNLLKSYVFSQGFISIYLAKHETNSEGSSRSCVYYTNNNLVCRSNLGIITGRDEYNCDCVFRLEVNVTSLDISQYAHVIKNLLTLGAGYWLNLSSLSFCIYFDLNNPLRSREMMSLEESSATIPNYIHDFQNRLPNITHLNVGLTKDIFLRTALYILIDHYAPRLQLLYIDYPLRSPLPVFSTELTSLSLDLDEYTYRHSSFYAKSLQYLELFNISSSSFLWRIFYGFMTPGSIEFTDLKALNLLYKDQADEEKDLSEKHSKQARPHGSHLLQFPKLENLILYRPPVDCDVFFTDTIPTNLKELRIRGSCYSVVAASRLQFTSVNELEIKVFGEETPNDAFYIAADRYFGYTKIGSSCITSLNLLIDIKRTVSWVHVTSLKLLKIGFDELLHHIPNFYNLLELNVENVDLSDKSFSIIQLGLEEEKQELFELLDTRLEYLILGGIEPVDPYNILAILNHLVLRTTTLKEITISSSQSGIVEKSFLPRKFPHVRFS